MKFGEHLYRYQILEWAPFYINYQELKILYKNAKSLSANTGEDADLTGLHCQVHLPFDSDIGQISKLFYNETYRKRVTSTHVSMIFSSRRCKSWPNITVLQTSGI